MTIDVENIDKRDNNTWRTIYEAIDEKCFKKLICFLKIFLNTMKAQMCHKIFHLKS